MRLDQIDKVMAMTKTPKSAERIDSFDKDSRIRLSENKGLCEHFNIVWHNYQTKVSKL